MRTKMIWGLGVLIVGLIIGGVFLLRKPYTEPEKRFVTPSEEVIKQAQEANKPSRPARPGYEWVWHNDHYDEIPVAQTAGGDEQHVTQVSTQQIEVSNSDFSVVPTYASLEQMSDHELEKLREESYKAYKLLYPEYDKARDAYYEVVIANGGEVSAKSKQLYEVYKPIQEKYNFHFESASRALKVLNLRISKKISSHPVSPIIIKLRDPIVDP